MDITGRKLFVKALQEEGVDTIFGYPGGTVTDLFDELYKQDEIEIVLPRHEQGLYMRQRDMQNRQEKWVSAGDQRSRCNEHHDRTCRCTL